MARLPEIVTLVTEAAPVEYEIYRTRALPFVSERAMKRKLNEYGEMGYTVAAFVPADDWWIFIFSRPKEALDDD